jgi:hypothetical protein
MHVVYPVWCGRDVPQGQRTACRRSVSPEGQMTLERRACGPPSGELLARRDWRAAPACPVVALESPGVSWRPAYHVLVGTVEGLVGHARDLRPRPGKKPAPAAAAWSAAWWAHGLIRPSVVPPPALRA